MTATEFAEWIALLAIEPWGGYRADIHAGLIRQTTERPHLPRRVSKTLNDYLPPWAKSDPTQRPGGRLGWRRSVDLLFETLGG